METLLQDIRYGTRRLFKSPAFTFIVVLTLALGIGANTAIFSVVNALLLRPLPFDRPEQLVTIFHFYPTLKDLEAPVSAPGYRRYREQTRSFQSVAVQSGWAPNLAREGADPERLQGTLVSADFFKVYGVRPMLGRALLPEEDVPGRNHVVVLSYGLWQRLFNGRPDAIGRTLQLNGEPYEVVGVMPHSFINFWNRDAEIWSPLALEPEAYARDVEFLPLTARLKPGLTEKDAATEMRRVADDIKRESEGEYPPSWTLKVKSLNEQAVGRIRPALLVLLGSVAFVLLIACANVANLLLARAAGRMKEVAVRTALGASRTRIIRQLLTESVLLSVSGGAVGLLFAYWGVEAISNLSADSVPFASDVRIDGNVLVFTFILAVVTGLLFGMVPALQSLRSDVQKTLREEGRGTTSDKSGHLLRRSLVVAEVALALTLLTGAGLLMRSFARVQSVDAGFDPTHLLTFNVAPPLTKYTSDTTQVAFYNATVDAIRQVPGVQAVGLTSTLPFSGGWSTGSFDIEGYEVPPDQPNPWGDERLVSEDFATAMKLPILKGRFFTAADRADSPPVVVIDDKLAEKYFKGQDPIGKRISEGNIPGTETPLWITIVGVVAHSKQEGLEGEDRVQRYFPLRQAVGDGRNIGIMSYAVRTTGDPLALTNAVRRAVRSVDPAQPIANVNTMERLMADTLGQRRLSMVLLGIFAGLAVVLASLGIYGVMSQLVIQRKRELGVRMALGAGTREVLRIVLLQGMTLAGLGVMFGVGGAFALTRVIRNQLFNIEPTDPLTFGTVAVLLVSVAFLATCIPALRAARLDPVRALREE